MFQLDIPVKKILVVDDEPFIHKIVSTVLQKGRPDIEIKIARNGEEANRLLVEFRPDLMLVDVLMPNMDGISFVKGLKSNQETQNIPIIFVTAVANEDSFKPILEEENVLGVIAKPFTIESFLQQISEMFNKNQD